MARRLPLVTMLVTAAAFAPFASAADSQRDKLDFFEKIRPVLTTTCFKCHSSASPKLKGGLNLESRQGLLKGGETGPSIVPGHPEKSLLMEAVRYTRDDLQMPPKEKLSDAAIADFAKWIEMGAPFPGGKITLPARQQNPADNYEKLRKQHWAWQPLKTVAVPKVNDANWPTSDIDRFVLARIEKENLHPVGPADKYTLVRRVTFDLTGLPPTPDQVQAFVSDESPDAYAKLVDRLLSSPAFGEFWGRHWLDVARYAESTGSSRNFPFEYAWRYRDYVIDSFNKDKPYNVFLVEQLAGDLLGWRTPQQHDEQMVATGFLAVGIKDLNERDSVKYQMDNVDEQIDTTSRAMLGITVGCARCHDHKFDPIPQADYYKWAGIFRSTDILCGLHPRRGPGRDLSDTSLLARLDPVPGAPGAKRQAVAPDPQQIQLIAQELQQAQMQLQRIETVLQRFERGGPRRVSVTTADDGDRKRLRRLRKLVEEKREEVAGLQSDLDAAKRGVPAGELFAVGVRDSLRIGNSPIYAHGEIDSPGLEVPRGTVSLCNFVRFDPVPVNRSGRLELARWIASPQNPLTTRVVVNRVWEHLFGEGIVRTVDNFGTTGEAPTHPELLDYLAARFIHNGWSFKKTIREIVLSKTYQLAGTYDPSDAAIDPGDKLLWRMQPRRLEAEEIRDAILAAAGTLDLKRPEGSPVMSFPPIELRRFGPGQLGINQMTCRSVYLPILRSEMPQVLDVFDVADPDTVTGQREVTTVAPQALFLMNNPLVIQQSRSFARRLTSDANLSDDVRADMAYRLALGRPPTAQERKRAVNYVQSFTPRGEGWPSFCQALFASAEFRYVN